MSDQSIKQDANKPHVEWVPPEVVWAMAAVRGYGVSKYGDPESYKAVEPERMLAAAYRHLLQVLADPEALDAESGLPHLWHCLCDIGLMVAQTYRGPGRTATISGDCEDCLWLNRPKDDYPCSACLQPFLWEPKEG